MREANDRAAAQIFERVNSSLLPKNILDLHGLHVDEALEHLDQVLGDKTAGTVWLENVGKNSGITAVGCKPPNHTTS